jgi:arginyl-tRNA synthetase
MQINFLFPYFYFRFSTHKFDQLLYVVDSSQSDHFAAMKHLLNAMGHEWSDRITHIKFGRIHGMSTRKGNAVFLKDILDEAKARVIAKQQQTASK